MTLGGGPNAESTTHTDELFAVNAGSNTITAFRTDGAKALERIGKPVKSGGTKPTSITVNGDLLYLLGRAEQGREVRVRHELLLNDVSSYKIGDDGSLTLLDATAGKLGSGLGGLLGGLGGQLDAALPVGVGAGANDEAISADKKYLYARDFFGGSITGWKIGDDGSLTRTGTVNGVGPAAGFGLAAD